MRIFKYIIPLVAQQKVLLPVGARILSIQFQGGHLCIWAAVDPEEIRTSPRDIRIVGTGHEIDANATYITTVQQAFYVWHIFEAN